jgi:NADPH:quinone reductase-like Zn-dependent oxidoreductase
MMASPTTTTQQSHHSHSRGIYFGGFQQPVYERTEEKVCLKPQRNHLLVQVHAVGLNPVDAKQVIGDKLAYEWKTIRKVAHNLLVKHTRVGFDFAGISMNEHHPEFPIGTRVFGTMPPLQGSCAEYIQVPLHQVAKSPQQWSMEEAAAMPLVGLTAWQALSPCIAPEKSSRVLIIGGSGGTGHVALQVAKALGAHDIVTICSTRNIDFCKECGATQVLDYTQSEDIMQDLQQLVSRQQQQFDVILDCVTSADPEDARHEYPKRVRNSTLGIVAPNHLYQRLGGTWSDWIRAGLARTRLFPIKWLWKDPRERLFWIRFPHSSHELEELAGLSSQLKPKIQKVYPEMTAATVQQAFGDILSRRVQGKVVIQVVVPPNKEAE